MDAGAALIHLGPVSLDLADRTLIGDRGEARLSPLAARLLVLLAAQPGHVISREEIIAELWNGNHYVGDSALNRLVSETRRVARETGSTSLIETVQKSGYRLTVAGPRQPSVQLPPDRASMWHLAKLLIVFAVVVGGLIWLMDTATGLLWLVRHPN